MNILPMRREISTLIINAIQAELAPLKTRKGNGTTLHILDIPYEFEIKSNSREITITLDGPGTPHIVRFDVGDAFDPSTDYSIVIERIVNAVKLFFKFFQNANWAAFYEFLQCGDGSQP